MLAGQGHEGKIYELTGSIWSYSDLAAALVRVSGRPVAYREVDGTGLPPRMAWFFGLVRSGALKYSTPDLERLLGHPPACYRERVSRVARRAPAPTISAMAASESWGFRFTPRQASMSTVTR